MVGPPGSPGASADHVRCSGSYSSPRTGACRACRRNGARRVESRSGLAALATRWYSPIRPRPSPVRREGRCWRRGGKSGVQRGINGDEPVEPVEGEHPPNGTGGDRQPQLGAIGGGALVGACPPRPHPRNQGPSPQVRRAPARPDRRRILRRQSPACAKSRDISLPGPSGQRFPPGAHCIPPGGLHCLYREDAKAASASP